MALATTVLALFLAELAHRVWRSTSGWPFDSADMRTAFVQARNFATQAIPEPADAAAAEKQPQSAKERWVLDPYNGIDVAVMDKQIEVELAFADQRRDGVYTILVLGGSVAGLFTTVGGSTFVDVVSRDPRFQGKHVMLSNHARGGYKQPQQSNELIFLLAIGYRPSAVIEIDGFNEVALGNDNSQNGVHPLYPSRTHWLHFVGSGAADPESADLMDQIRAAQERTVRLANFGLDYGLWRSSLLGTLLQRNLRRSLRAGSEAQAAYGDRLTSASIERGMTGPAIHGGRERGLAIAVEGWAQTSACMQAICKARGIPYLHVLQPTLHDEGSKPVTSDEISNGNAAPEWIEGVRLGYPLLRERGARLRDEGVTFVDGSRIFADVRETLYYDVCHFGQTGNEMFARFVADAFLASLPPAPR